MIDLFPKTGPSTMKKPEPNMLPSKCIENILVGDIDEDKMNFLISKKEIQTKRIIETPTIQSSSTHYQNATYRELNILNVQRSFLILFNYHGTLFENILPLKYTIKHVLNIMRLWRCSDGHSILVGDSGSGKKVVVQIAALICGHTLFHGRTTTEDDDKDNNTTLWRTNFNKAVNAACDLDELNKKEDDDKKKDNNEHSNNIIYVVDGTIEENINNIQLFSTIKMFLLDPLNTFNTYITLKQKIILIEKTRNWIIRYIGMKQEQNMTDSIVVTDYIIPRLKKRLNIIILTNTAYINHLNVRTFHTMVGMDYYIKRSANDVENIITMGMRTITFDTKNQCQKISQFMIDCHYDAIKKSSEYYKSHAIQINTTSSLLFSIINLYKYHLMKQKLKYITKRNRYKNGISKLKFSEASIDQMNKDLKRLLPKIEKMNSETESLIKIINKKMPSIEIKRKVVKEETLAAEEEQKRVSGIQKECELSLNEALPMLEDANNALNTIKKKEIDEVKSFRNPPELVRLVMEAVCIMLDEKPNKIPDPKDSSRKLDEWWSISKRLLGDATLLNQLIHYDKDDMNESTLNLIREKYIAQLDPEKLIKVSKAATGLCLWVRAMECYDRIIRIVKPKQYLLDIANDTLYESRNKLDIKKDELKVIEKDLLLLEKKKNKSVSKLKDLKLDEDLCRLKLIRAEEILLSLGNENDRWRSEVDYCLQCESKLPGDVLIASLLINYTGQYNSITRNYLRDQWINKLRKNNSIPFTKEYYNNETGASTNKIISKVLGSTVEIRQWRNQGLASGDVYSEETAMMMINGIKFSLFIDPQSKGKEWITNKENDRINKEMMEEMKNINEKNVNSSTPTDNNISKHISKFIIMRPTDKDLIQNVRNAAIDGDHVLIEHCDSDPPELLKLYLKRIPILNEDNFIEYVIQLDDNTFSHPDFYIYLCTSKEQPMYSPSTTALINILNFRLTVQGTVAIFLNTIVNHEEYELQQHKNKFMLENTYYTTLLYNCEETILKTLSNTKGNLLENENAVNTLKTNKTMSDDIKIKQKRTILLEKKLDIKRTIYKPLANICQRIFFVIQKLVRVNHFYAFSLQWYIKLIHKALSNDRPKSMDGAALPTKQQTDVMKAWCNNVRNRLQLLLIDKISISIFTKDKKLFPMLMAIEEMRYTKNMTKKEYHFFLFGSIIGGKNDEDQSPPLKKPVFINNNSWLELTKLCSLSNYRGICTSICNDTIPWKSWINHPKPETLPIPIRCSLNDVQQLLIIKCLRHDRLTHAIDIYLKNAYNSINITNKTFKLSDLLGSGSETTATTATTPSTVLPTKSSIPIIFVLSIGTDPTLDIRRLAKIKKIRLNVISMGNGTEEQAETSIRKARSDGRGDWLLLQNCHLVPEWLSKLQVLCSSNTSSTTISKSSSSNRNKSQKSHNDQHRLMLTTYPIEAFPSWLIRHCMKITMENPVGIKSNLMKLYNNNILRDEYLLDELKSTKGETFRKCMYSLCLFHSSFNESKCFIVIVTVIVIVSSNDGGSSVSVLVVFSFNVITK